MSGSINIAIRKEHVTDDLMEHILKMDSLGLIALDTKPKRLAGETWVEAFERDNSFTDEFLTSHTAQAFGVDSKIVDSKTIYMGADSDLDETQLADELSKFNTELRVWFESNDGYNPYELLIFEDGDHVVYDVEYDDSISYIRAEAVNLIRHYPPQEFKAVVLDLLQSTRYNDKSDYHKPLREILPKHKITSVLWKLDEGSISSSEAMGLIKEINKPAINEYMVFIDSEYCDGQAYIDNPNGEFGGDGYVELSSTYPICVGTYRGESPEQAISHAASNMDASEEIFTAVQIQK